MSNKSILAIILIIVAGVVYYFTKDKIDTASKDETIKLGIIYGYTGPIESLTPDMAKAAELAIADLQQLLLHYLTCPIMTYFLEQRRLTLVRV